MASSSHVPAEHQHDQGQSFTSTSATTEELWDNRYRSSTRTWSGNPNPQLVAETTDLTPGTALDVGCGEGADAIWLAERGWTVTGLDISSIALARADEHARSRDVEISWQHVDLASWQPVQTYDLVSAQFIHQPQPDRGALHHELAAATAPGGTLLIVAHHPSDLQLDVKRPPKPELFFDAGEVVALLDPAEWTIQVQAARPREGTSTQGEPITVHDTVLRAQRTR